MQRRIVMCDDEVHVVRAAGIKLRQAGFDVHCSMDGEEAWLEIQRQRPDLLITDRQMPRLDGLQLIARIKQHAELADLPIILLTSRGHDLPTAEELGIAAVIDKPFSPRALVKQAAAAADSLKAAP